MVVIQTYLVARYSRSEHSAVGLGDAERAVGILPCAVSGEAVCCKRKLVSAVIVEFERYCRIARTGSEGIDLLRHAVLYHGAQKSG